MTPSSPASTARPILTPQQLTPVVSFNAGGQVFDLPQAAVDAFPDSDLARWTHGALYAPHDDAGRLFINRSAAGVGTLVDYLRGGQQLQSLEGSQLAAIAAESQALHMGKELDDTLERERLRRRVGTLTLTDMMTAPPPERPFDRRPRRREPEVARDWLRYQDLCAARGEVDESANLKAASWLPERYEQDLVAHYAPLLAANPDHRRALLFLSHVSLDSTRVTEQLANAKHLYELAPHDPTAQVNLVMILLSTESDGTPMPAGRDRAPALARLIELLRDLPGEDASEGAARQALATRLEGTTLAAYELEMSNAANRDAALEVGMLLRRLRRQHNTTRHDYLAFLDDRTLFTESAGPLIDYATCLLSLRVLRLSDTAKLQAPTDWWFLRLEQERGHAMCRGRLQTNDMNPLLDADAPNLQAAYEELWTAYDARGDDALLAILASGLDNSNCQSEPQMQAILTAQKARLEAAAA